MSLKEIKIRIAISYIVFYINGAAVLFNVAISNMDTALFNLLFMVIGLLAVFSLDAVREQLEKDEKSLDKHDSDDSIE